MGSTIDRKEGNIEELEVLFSEKHEQIKNQVEHFIEL